MGSSCRVETVISREEWINLEREPVSRLARVQTPVASYSFDPLDPLDIARCAELVSDDCGMHINDVRAALSRAERGRTVRLKAA
jgi:hypothetical protein